MTIKRIGFLVLYYDRHGKLLYAESKGQRWPVK
jgi:hypothetical protein